MFAKTAIVTGANHGIGLEVARGLVAQGYDVTLAVRDVAKGDAAAREIGGGQPMRVDVADLDSVRAFAQAFRARHDKLHLLVNNAGIHTALRQRSPQGHELTFATNHLGHFLLTQELLPLLRAGAPSRIVNVASEAHRGALGNDFAQANAWSGMRAYTQSKLANIMFTYALARRLAGTGVSAFAVHPGSVATRWARGRESGVFRFATALARPFLLSPERGARTPLYAATSPELEGKSGLYLVRRKVATSASLSRDVAAQEALWEQSLRLVAGNL